MPETLKSIKKASHTDQNNQSVPNFTFANIVRVQGASYPPYPVNQIVYKATNVPDTIMAGKEVRQTLKNTSAPTSRPPPKPAKPKRPKVTDVRATASEMRRHARCLRIHDIALSKAMERLSKPPRRTIICQWREYGAILSPERIARLSKMLDAEEPMKPDHAYDVFVSLGKKFNSTKPCPHANRYTKKRFSSKSRLSKMHPFIKHTLIAFAKGFQRRFSPPTQVILSNKMMRLSTIILEDICKGLKIIKPAINCPAKDSQFLLEAVNKIALWIEDILLESDERLLMMDVDEDEFDVDGFMDMVGKPGGIRKMRRVQPAYKKLTGDERIAFEHLIKDMNGKTTHTLLEWGKFKQSYQDAVTSLKKTQMLDAFEYDKKLAETIAKKLHETVELDTQIYLMPIMDRLIETCSRFLAFNAVNHEQKGEAYYFLLAKMKDNTAKLYQHGHVSRTYAEAFMDLDNSTDLKANHDDPNLSQQILEHLEKLVKEHTPHSMQTDMAETLLVVSKYLSQIAVNENMARPSFYGLSSDSSEKSSGGSSSRGSPSKRAPNAASKTRDDMSPSSAGGTSGSKKNVTVGYVKIHSRPLTGALSSIFGMPDSTCSSDETSPRAVVNAAGDTCGQITDLSSIFVSQDDFDLTETTNEEGMLLSNDTISYELCSMTFLEELNRTDKERALDLLIKHLRDAGAQVFHRQLDHQLLYEQAAECSDLKKSADLDRLRLKFEKKLTKVVADSLFTREHLREEMQDVVIESSCYLSERFVSYYYNELARCILVSAMQKRGNEILIELDDVIETYFFAAQRLKKTTSLHATDPCEEIACTLLKKLEDVILGRPVPKTLTVILKGSIKDAAYFLSEWVTKPDDAIEAYVALLAEMENAGDSVLFEGNVKKSFKDCEAYLKRLTSCKDKIKIPNPQLQLYVANKLNKLVEYIDGYRPSVMKDVIVYTSRLLVSYITLQENKFNLLKILMCEMTKMGDKLILQHGCCCKSYKDAVLILTKTDADRLAVKGADPVITRKLQIKLSNLVEGLISTNLQSLMDEVIDDAAKHLAVHLLQSSTEICTSPTHKHVQCELWTDEVLRRRSALRCTCTRHLSDKRLHRKQRTSTSSIPTKEFNRFCLASTHRNTLMTFKRAIFASIDVPSTSGIIRNQRKESVSDSTDSSFHTPFNSNSIDELRVSSPCSKCSMSTAGSSTGDWADSTQLEQAYSHVGFVVCEVKAFGDEGGKTSADSPAGFSLDSPLEEDPPEKKLLKESNLGGSNLEENHPKESSLKENLPKGCISEESSPNVNAIIESPTRRSPTRASPIRANRIKASPTRASPKRASPTKASPMRASSPTRASPTRASPTRATPTRASPTRASPTRTSATRALTTRESPTRRGTTTVSPTRSPTRTSPTLGSSMEGSPRRRSPLKRSPTEANSSPSELTEHLTDWQAMMMSIMWNVQAWRDWVQDNINLATTNEQQLEATEESNRAWTLFMRKITKEALQWRHYNNFIKNLSSRVYAKCKEEDSTELHYGAAQAYMTCQQEIADIIEMTGRWTEYVINIAKDTNGSDEKPHSQLRWTQFIEKLETFFQEWNHYCMHLRMSWEQKHSSAITEWLPSFEESGPVWVVSACGVVPNGAIAAGPFNDEQTWVARTTHRGRVVPAALVTSKNSCIVYADGTVHYYTKYQVMCNAKAKWIKRQAGPLHARALRVALGTHAGRVMHRGSYLLGAVLAPENYCHVVISGRAHTVNTYELLVLDN